MLDKTYIALFRCLLTKPIWLNSTPEQCKILITLLLMANHKEKVWEWNGTKFEAKAGQFVTSLDAIVTRCGKGITIQNVRTALTRFKKLGFLTEESTKTGRLITIVNWHLYQIEIREANKDDNKDLTKTSQRANKELTPNNNVNNVDNEINNNISPGGDSPPDDGATKPPARINYQEIADKYNSICSCLPKCTRVTDSRKRAVKGLYNSKYTLDNMVQVFHKARDSDFLSGRNGKWGGCSFDWLLNQTNFLKVLEGSYDNDRNLQPQQANKPPPVNLDQIWEQVKRKLDPYNAPTWDNPVIKKAVDRVGYTKLCEMPEEYAKRIFESAYQNTLKEVG